jgi:hypothetical protein
MPIWLLQEINLILFEIGTWCPDGYNVAYYDVGTVFWR